MAELYYPFQKDQYDKIKTEGISTGQLLRELSPSDMQQMVAYINLSRLMKSGLADTSGTAPVNVSKPIPPQMFKMHDPYANNWKMTDRNGYVRIYDEKPAEHNWTKFAYEHRAVLENFMQRKLKGEEVVHHQSRIRSHNTMDNLELAKNKSEHVLKDHPEWLRKKQPR
jgi:hypothetical protein